MNDRTMRYLRRVDWDLADMHPLARARCFDALIKGWEERYSRWLKTDGKSEFCADPYNPIDAADFLTTIAELSKRRSALLGGPRNWQRESAARS